MPLMKIHTKKESICSHIDQLIMYWSADQVVNGGVNTCFFFNLSFILSPNTGGLYARKMASICFSR